MEKNRSCSAYNKVHKACMQLDVIDARSEETNMMMYYQSYQNEPVQQQELDLERRTSYVERRERVDLMVNGWQADVVLPNYYIQSSLT